MNWIHDKSEETGRFQDFYPSNWKHDVSGNREDHWKRNIFGAEQELSFGVCKV